MQRVTNVAKERLSQGALAIGIGVRTVRGVEIARIMKTAGFDFLFIDMEHGATSVETTYAICVAALDAGIAPFIRVPHGELALGTRCLDAGGLGLVIPHVDTPDVARAMVDAFKFHPLGRRRLSSVRLRGRSRQGCRHRLNDATLVVAMIETPKAVENAEQIAAVP